MMYTVVEAEGHTKQSTHGTYGSVRVNSHQYPTKTRLAAVSSVYVSKAKVDHDQYVGEG